jgi:hypothetical protein
VSQRDEAEIGSIGSIGWVDLTVRGAGRWWESATRAAPMPICRRGGGPVLAGQVVPSAGPERHG